MKYFIAALLSTSAYATEFTCSAYMEGKQIAKDTIEVTDEANTELYIGNYKGIDLIGKTVFGQVSSLMITDGIMYGTISMNAASYRMYLLGEGELQLDCGLN